MHAALEARAQAEGAELRNKELGKEAQRMSQDRCEGLCRGTDTQPCHNGPLDRVQEA